MGRAEGKRMELPQDSSEKQKPMSSIKLLSDFSDSPAMGSLFRNKHVKELKIEPPTPPLFRKSETAAKYVLTK